MIWALMNIQSIIRSCREVAQKYPNEDDWQYIDRELSFVEKDFGPLAREIDELIRRKVNE